MLADTSTRWATSSISTVTGRSIEPSTPLGDLGRAGVVGVVPIGRCAQHDDELVAADAAHHVLAAHDVTDAGGDDAEELVAGVVAEAVVDVLEAVEVEVQHADDGQLGCAQGTARGHAPYAGPPGPGSTMSGSPSLSLSGPDSRVRHTVALAWENPLLKTMS